jgi:hypothetical protein
MRMSSTGRHAGVLALFSSKDWIVWIARCSHHRTSITGMRMIGVTGRAATGSPDKSSGQGQHATDHFATRERVRAIYVLRRRLFLRIKRADFRIGSRATTPAGVPTDHSRCQRNIRGRRDNSKLCAS